MIVILFSIAGVILAARVVFAAGMIFCNNLTIHLIRTNKKMRMSWMDLCSTAEKLSQTTERDEKPVPERGKYEV